MTKPQNTRRVKWIKSLRGSLKGTGVLKILMKSRKRGRGI